MTKWHLKVTDLFEQIYVDLLESVEKLSLERPDSYKSHFRTRLLAGIYYAITIDVPADPMAQKFYLGNTLPQKYTNWRRVKKKLLPRYRLFFQYSSANSKIIYGWVNNEHTLRSSNSRTDVYKTFRKMLDNGEILNDFDALDRDAKSFEG